MNKFTHSLLGLMALGVLVPLALAGCSDVSEDLNTPTYSTGLKADELKMSAFKDKFPKPCTNSDELVMQQKVLVETI